MTAPLDNSLTLRRRLTPSFRTLEKLGLFPAGRLIRNGDHNVRVAESIARGDEEHITSRDMYQRLNWIQEAYPWTQLHVDMIQETWPRLVGRPP